MTNIEGESVSRFEVSGLLIGAFTGASFPLYGWCTWGQFHPHLALAWGVPLNDFTCVTAPAGALFGIAVGNALRHTITQPNTRK